jgi:hypothetical protein
MFFEIYIYYNFVFILVFIPFYQVKDLFPIYFYKKSVIFGDIMNKKTSKSASLEEKSSKPTNSSNDSASSSNKDNITNSGIENNDDPSTLKKVLRVVIPVVCVVTLIFGCYYIYKNFPPEFFDPKKPPAPSPSSFSSSLYSSLSVPPLRPFPSLEVSPLGLSEDQQDYLFYILNKISSYSIEHKSKIFDIVLNKPYRYGEVLRVLEKEYYDQYNSK